jgi:hypothetical protein
LHCPPSQFLDEPAWKLSWFIEIHNAVNKAAAGDQKPSGHVSVEQFEAMQRGGQP